MTGLPVIGGIVDSIGDIVSRFKSSDEDRLQKAALEMEPLLTQLRTNLAEAQHPSSFVAGARPAAIWVCVIGLFWQVVLYPIVTWVWAFLHMQGALPPSLNIEVLNTMLFALLGIGGMRSFDKVKGTDTKQMSR
jgi:hypothetical protein